MEIQPLIEKAIQVIKQIEYLNISSITLEGLPWGSPVYTAYDKNLNFFWVSWKENQHSQNIKNNSNVFVTLYDSTVPCSTGFGVYLKGIAKMVKDPIEMVKILMTFYGRRGKNPRDFKQFLSKYPRRLYKFTPEQVWVNGDGEINGNFIDVRTELPLSELVKILGGNSTRELS